MSYHSTMTGIAMHAPFMWTFADESARTNATNPNTSEAYQTSQLYNFALQSDDNSVWMLTATTPSWEEISAFSAVGDGTIYTADGTLTGLRTVQGFDGADLIFEHFDTEDDLFNTRGQWSLADTGWSVQISAGDGSGSATSFQSISITSSQGIKITDTTNSLGLVYAADYSANFTARSVPDVDYVNEADLAATSSRTIQVQNDGIFIIESVEDQGDAVGDDRFQLKLNDSGVSAIWHIEEDGVGAQTYAGLIFASDHEISIIDSINSKGLKYSGNYHDNFEDRSLPDVDWVRQNVFPRWDAGGDETLTLSGMSNSDFDGDYEEMTNYGTTGASSQFEFGSTYKSYWRYDGTSTWYVVLYSTSQNQWEAIDSITDPETWVDDEDLASLVSNTEFFTANSDTDDGYNIPDAADSNVSYDAKADMYIDTDLFLSGQVLRFYHGSASSASPTELFSLHGDEGGSESNPQVQFHAGVNFANEIFLNMGKGTNIKFNDGTKATDIFEMLTVLNGSGVVQYMAFDSHVQEFNWLQMGNQNWYLSDSTTNRTWTIWDGDEDNSPNEVMSIDNDVVTNFKALVMDEAHLRFTCRTTTADQWRMRTDGDDLYLFYYDDSESSSTDVAALSVANLALEFPSDFGVQFDHVGGASNGYWKFDHNGTNDYLELIHNDGTTSTIYLEIDDDTLAANFHGDVTADSFDLHPYQISKASATSGVVIALDDGSTVPSEVQLVLDQIDVANASIYTLASNSITMLKGGTFQITIGLLIDETNTSGGTRGRVSCYMKIDGTQVSQSIGATYMREATPGTGIDVTFITALAADDVLTFWALMEAETANDPPNCEQGETHVSMIQVGP